MNISINVGKTIRNHPFGNALYNLFMVIWGMVYGIVLPTLNNGNKNPLVNYSLLWRITIFHREINYFYGYTLW